MWALGCGVKPRRLRGRLGFTRQPENSKRAHLTAPAQFRMYVAVCHHFFEERSTNSGIVGVLGFGAFGVKAAVECVTKHDEKMLAAVSLLTFFLGVERGLAKVGQTRRQSGIGQSRGVA